ncbi:MAG: acetyl-CoA carboxylase biotin carboxyl carrier protein [Campylobacterales bacterium]
MNLKELKELLRAFDKSETQILELETENFRLYLDKSKGEEGVGVPQSVPQPQLPEGQPQLSPPSQSHPSPPSVEEKREPEGEIISSPMVGTFYQAPSPDSPPYVRVGDRIQKGQTLCIIEAMKIMNELEAEFDCEILEVLVEDGQPVEFDTPLFRVKRV